MILYYIWDAYCGWSYGFNHLLKDYLSKHPDTNLNIISGGLFLDSLAQPIANFSHIPQANQSISQLYGVSFGSAYEDLLKKGDLVLDSLYPATAFALMREKISKQKHLNLALSIQKSFYQEGKDLRNPTTYEELATEFGIDRQVLQQELKESFANQELGKIDIELADLLGVTSYPTLIIEVEGKFAVLDTALSDVTAFEAELEQAVAHLQEETATHE